MLDPFGSERSAATWIRAVYGRLRGGAFVASTPIRFMAAPTLLHPRADLIEVGDDRRVRLLQVIGKNQEF